MDLGPAHPPTTPCPHPVGIRMASDSQSGDLRLPVLCMALVPPQGALSVQTHPCSAPPLQQPVCVGDPVPPPLGAGHRRIPDHHQFVVPSVPPADHVELHVTEYNGQCRGPHRIRVPVLCPQLGAIRGGGRGPETRHAPPEADDQLPAFLQSLGQTV